MTDELKAALVNWLSEKKQAALMKLRMAQITGGKAAELAGPVAPGDLMEMVSEEMTPAELELLTHVPEY